MDDVRKQIKLILGTIAENTQTYADKETTTIDADDAYWLVNTVEELQEKVERYEKALDSIVREEERELLQKEYLAKRAK